MWKLVRWEKGIMSSFKPPFKGCVVQFPPAAMLLILIGGSVLLTMLFTGRWGEEERVKKAEQELLQKLALERTTLREHKFDPEKWQAARTPDEKRERFGMLADFLKTHQVAGMTRSRIVELLGQPDHQSDSFWYDFYDVNGDSETRLEIHFDDGRADRCEIHVRP